MAGDKGSDPAADGAEFLKGPRGLTPCPQPSHSRHLRCITLQNRTLQKSSVPPHREATRERLSLLLRPASTERPLAAAAGNCPLESANRIPFVASAPTPRSTAQ